MSPESAVQYTPAFIGGGLACEPIFLWELIVILENLSAASENPRAALALLIAAVNKCYQVNIEIQAYHYKFDLNKCQFTTFKML